MLDTTLMTTILACASAIVLIANAAEKIINVIKAARTPVNQQLSRLDTLEKWREEVDRKLNHDNDRLASIDASSMVTQRAILALLDHGINGNNVEQMLEARDELYNDLTRKKKEI